MSGYKDMLKKGTSKGSSLVGQAKGRAVCPAKGMSESPLISTIY